MSIRLSFTLDARDQIQALKRSNPGKHKKIVKCLAWLESQPKHPGLHSHRYEDLDQAFGQKIWQSYVENRTPGAYRVFWHFGPGKSEITIVAITPHP